MHGTEKTARPAVRRLARAAGVYAFSAAVMIFPALVLVVEVSVAKDIPEGGLSESLQTGLLFLSAAAWAFLAASPRSRRRGLSKAYATVAFAAFGMFVRELDCFFDDLLWHGAWAAVDAVVLCAAAAVLLRDWRGTLASLADFAESAHGLMAFAAVFAAIAFSQLLGWKEIWRSLFDIEPWRQVRQEVFVYDQNLERHVKNVVEEALELFSYASLLVAAVVPRFLAPRGANGGGGAPERENAA